MARVIEITSSASARINTGNYEGTEFFTCMKVEVDEFDDAGEEQAKLDQMVETALMVQLVASYKGRGKNLTPGQIARQHGLGNVRIKTND